MDTPLLRLWRVNCLWLGTPVADRATLIMEVSVRVSRGEEGDRRNAGAEPNAGTVLEASLQARTGQVGELGILGARRETA